MRHLTRRPHIALAVAVVATWALTSCGGGGGGGPTGNTGAGSMSARIDGASWTSTSSSANATTGGIFTLTGVQATSGTGVSMTLYYIGAPGTYPLGVGGVVAGGLASVVAGSAGWSTPLSGNAGTVTITAVSATRIAGTFAFTAPLVTGTSAVTSRAVTQGQFDLAVTGPATLVVPANAGSIVNGTLAGVAFNAATVASVVSPVSGVFSFAGSNTNQTLNVILSEYTGVGTYALGTGASRTIRLTNLNAPTGTWGGSNATTAGTLTVTSASASRIKGSVSATLQPVAGTSGAAVTITATFDIGI
jgi:Family of unknown function (DUF6252)